MPVTETPLPEPSIPTELRFQVQGYDDELANKIVGTVHAIIRDLSRFIPVGSLDGVTIAADYATAIKGLDRGADRPLSDLEATSDDEVGAGIAMAPLVVRNGVVKSHLVLGPAIVESLNHDPPNERAITTAVARIGHELGHVVDHEWKFSRFGPFAFRPISEFAPRHMDQYLWGLSGHLWDEYCANRIVTNVVKEGLGEASLFVSARDVYKSRIYEARQRLQRDLICLADFLEVVARNVRLVLLATGYILGRADGERDTGEPSQEVLDALADESSRDLVAFRSCLADLWDRRETWCSYSDFLRVNVPTLELLRRLQIFPMEKADGSLFVSLPFQP